MIQRQQTRSEHMVQMTPLMVGQLDVTPKTTFLISSLSLVFDEFLKPNGLVIESLTLIRFWR